MNVEALDQAPKNPCDSARTFQVCWLFGVSVAVVVHEGAATSPESCTSEFAALNSWKRYCGTNDAMSLVAALAVSVVDKPPTTCPLTGDCGVGVLSVGDADTVC